MASDCEIPVKFDVSSVDEILRKRGLEDNGTVQSYIDSECIRLMAGYTPFDQGGLIDSADQHTTIGSGKIEQGGSDAPYARRWYYEPANFSGAPRRGNRWFERMLNEGGRRSILEGAKKKAGAI